MANAQTQQEPIPFSQTSSLTPEGSPVPSTQKNTNPSIQPMAAAREPSEDANSEQTSQPSNSYINKRFDLWVVSLSEYSTNALYRHAFRLTEHPKNKHLFENPQIFHDLISSLKPSQYVYQIERGEETGKLHYQGFIKLPYRLRSKQLASMLNNDAYGIHFTTLRVYLNKHGYNFFSKKNYYVR